MRCSEFLDRYSEYDDSLLSPAELARFRAHLEACETCARYDRVLRKGRMVARQTPPPEPGDDFLPRLERRILPGGRTGTGGSPTSSRVLDPAPSTALAAASILLIGSAVVSLLGPIPQNGVGGGDGGRVAVAAAGGGAARVDAAAMEPLSESAVVPVALEDRAVVLASSRPTRPGSWGAGRVDPRWASSYSPLVTGPPRYRAPRSLPAGSEGSLQSD